jgi:hypothetical protein
LLTAQARAVALQPDGKIVVAGSGVASHDGRPEAPPEVVIARLRLERLARSELRLERVRILSTAVERGHLVSQRPAPGALREPGAKVSLTVSKGSRR